LLICPAPDGWNYPANGAPYESQISGFNDAARLARFANGGAGYERPFIVGAVLPESGLTYYDIPGEYHIKGYRYAYVNDHAVLVDQHTHQIVQIID